MLTDLTDVCCLSLLLYLMMPAELPKSACSRSLGKQYAPFEWFCCQTQHTCVLNKPIFTSWHHAAPYCTSHYLICTAQHAYISSSAAQHSTAQHSTAQHSTAQHSTARHGTAQHSTAQIHTCIGHQALLLSSISSLFSAANCSSFWKALSVINPDSVSLNLLNMGDRAMESSLFNSLLVAMYMFCTLR